MARKRARNKSRRIVARPSSWIGTGSHQYSSTSMRHISPSCLIDFTRKRPRRRAAPHIRAGATARQRLRQSCSRRTKYHVHAIVGLTANSPRASSAELQLKCRSCRLPRQAATVRASSPGRSNPRQIFLRTSGILPHLLNIVSLLSTTRRYVLLVAHALVHVAETTPKRNPVIPLHARQTRQAFSSITPAAAFVA